MNHRSTAVTSVFCLVVAACLVMPANTTHQGYAFAMTTGYASAFIGAVFGFTSWWRWPRGVTQPRIPFVMYRAPFEPEPDRAPYDWATEMDRAA